jgi:hypothetical protein
LRPAIALKELLRLPTEIDAAAVELPVALAVADAAGADVVGAELVVLLLLLHAATRRAAVAAATAVRPALADTEYNDVPRLFSRDMLVTCT